MDTNIYYTPENKGVIVTSNFAEIKKLMDLGVNPKVDYIQITATDFSKYDIRTISFDRVDNNFFKTIVRNVSDLKLETISFLRSTVDLSDAVVDAKHLFLGEQSNIDLSPENFINLEELSFLSVKTFKGKLLNKLESIKKAVLWDVTDSSLIEMLPNLNELTINKGIIQDLDIRQNIKLERLDVHYCSKLLQILLPNNSSLSWILIENCKKLDTSNLPSSITSVWPQKKVKKEEGVEKIYSTGDDDIDQMIIDLKNNMENFMKEAAPLYSQKDINNCLSILSDYTISIFKVSSKEEAMKIVKSTVLKLNKLNDKSNGSLIETNEREQITEILILGGYKMKFNSMEEDITEEWREW